MATPQFTIEQYHDTIRDFGQVAESYAFGMLSPEDQAKVRPSTPTRETAPTKSRFRQIAERSIARAENRILPIAVGGKNPAMAWKGSSLDMAPTSEWTGLVPQWIDELDPKFPEMNACVIAKPDEFIFIDNDTAKEFREGYEKFSHEKYPDSFTTSASPNHYQEHFRQTDLTRAMGNVVQFSVDGISLSVRQRNLYVLAEGSHHPSGRVYETVVDAEIIPMPDKLVEYIQHLEKKAHQDTTRPSTGNSQDDWKPIDITVEGAPIPRGQHDSTLFKIACSLRQRKWEKPAALEHLVEVCQERCVAYGQDYREMCEKKIASAWKYEVKETGKIEFPPAQEQPQTPVTVTEIVENESINPTELTADSMDYLPSTVLASTRLQDIYLEHFQDYGWPLTLALPALVTPASAVVPFQPRGDNLVFGDDVMTNLYTALIGDVGVGKSQIINWGASAIGIYEPPVGQHYFEGKWGSAEQMLKSLHKKQSVFTNKSVLINPDEWAHFFAKARIPDASFPTVLTTSFYRRHQIITVGGTGGGTEYPLNLAMSFIGGIVEQDFDVVFGASSLGGLYDRFLFGKAPDGFKWNYQPCPIPNGKHFLGWNLRPVQIDGSVYELVKDWNRESPSLGRVAEICVRIANIYACLDGRDTITGKDMEPLKPLALYEAGLRQTYRPNPGQNPDAVFANKALGWIQKHAHEWTSIARLKQHTWRIEQNLGPAVAVRSLIGLARSGRIELWLRENGNNLPSDYQGPTPKIGLVRRVK